MGEPKEPEDSIYNLRDEIDKIFRDVLTEEGFFDRVHFPVVDITEKNDILKIEIEIPGLCKEDIKLEMLGNTLVLEGNKIDQEGSERVKYVCMERRFGPFRRTIVLPTMTDITNVKTKHENGVLTITMPKRLERREAVKTIEIE
ncbi:MAG: Hsp20/alpha crystallin family protein [Deltaproteobacteria bacterium]|nr:Hsp20/alpha crystallin family protein [Deltaproteobacteria bacterium]